MDIIDSFRHSLSVCIRLLSWDVVDGRLQIRKAAVCGLVVITCGTQVYMWVFVDLLPTTSLYGENNVPTGLKFGL